jgi:hypothetical protein
MARMEQSGDIQKGSVMERVLLVEVGEALEVDVGWEYGRRDLELGCGRRDVGKPCAKLGFALVSTRAALHFTVHALIHLKSTSLA